MAHPLPRTKPKKESAVIVYYVYTSCIQSIKHFDSVQTSLRMIASTILLAFFVGIGFIFSSENRILLIDSIFNISLVGIVGILALGSVWHLDLIFYERLLISFFSEAFEMESRFTWLPRIHQAMLYGPSSQDKPKNIVFFYIGCGTTLILTAGLTLTYLLLPHGTLPMLLSILCTLILIPLYSYFLKKKTQSIEDLLTKLRVLKKKTHHGSS